MKGHFVDNTGRPVYFGRREDKPNLEATHDWVDGSPSRVGGTELWDGSAWVSHAAAVTEQEAIAANKAYRQSIRDDLPVILDAMIGALISSGAIDLNAVPQEAKDAWQRFKAAAGAI